MLVRRVDVSFFDWIQCESCATVANAIASSVAGSGPGSVVLRTKRSRAGFASLPIVSGFHRDAGCTASAIATLRGPVRRSMSDAIAVRQLSAATFRSASVIATRASFSASANVVVVTGGPAPGPVLNAGGAPGVPGVELAVADDCESPLRQAAAAPRSPSGAVMRNWRRVFTIWECEGRGRTQIVARTGRAGKNVSHSLRCERDGERHRVRRRTAATRIVARDRDVLVDRRESGRRDRQVVVACGAGNHADGVARHGGLSRSGDRDRRVLHPCARRGRLKCDRQRERQWTRERQTFAAAACGSASKKCETGQFEHTRLTSARVRRSPLLLTFDTSRCILISTADRSGMTRPTPLLQGTL